MKEPLTRRFERSMEILRRPMVHGELPPIASYADGKRCYIITEFFDRLIDWKFIVSDGDDGDLGSLFVSDVDRALEKHGLVTITDEPQEMGFLMGKVITSAAKRVVALTYTGESVIRNAGYVELANSFIRMRLFSLLEQLMPLLGKERLPVFLAHWDPCVQGIAQRYLEEQNEF